MNNPDGGPAYPELFREIIPFGRKGQYSVEQWRAQRGMSLRDYLAIHAGDEDIRPFISEMASAPGPRRTMAEARILARWAFADAMIAERNKNYV